MTDTRQITKRDLNKRLYMAVSFYGVKEWNDGAEAESTWLMRRSTAPSRNAAAASGSCFWPTCGGKMRSNWAIGSKVSPTPIWSSMTLPRNLPE
jgi:hypothetical protein